MRWTPFHFDDANAAVPQPLRAMMLRA